MKTKFKLIIITCFTATVLMGCKKVLDKMDLSAVSPSEVWSTSSNANAYLNNIYASLMPGNPSGTGNGTDEGIPYWRQTNAFMTGTATINSYDLFGIYKNIRDINFLLSNIDGASFDNTNKQYIKGQGLFWRAYSYYRLVKSYGGVPLILAPQSQEDLSALALPRNTTTECITQIVKDMDDAIALLPHTWSGNDVGRIDKGAAMAFKGRVLLFFASPLFNASNDIAKWQAAYDANLAAKNELDAQGKGLYENFGKIWDDPLNKEVIMVRRFNNPNAPYNQAAVRPIRYSVNAVGDDRPSLELVNAFPMVDGSAWNSKNRSYDTLFRRRDDRFYATIYYNGSPNQYIADMKTNNEFLWTYFTSISNAEGPNGISGIHNPVTPDPVSGLLWTGSSFYRIKSVDKNISAGQVNQASVDWPEIRYAEVLMNYGEAANELGKTSEALEVLYAIRKRAKIQAGSGNYGITAGGQSAIRTAYINERFIEFAFEGKRWDDLRRWKRFDILNDLQQRHGLAITLKPGQSEVNPKDDINVVYTKFTSTVVKTDLQNLTVLPQYYIYGIPKSVLDKNPKFQQNNNWGGTFDPLK